jgi:hypothetical protein
MPQVPQVHQNCVRADLSTVRQPEVRGEISPRIKCSSLRFKCNSLLYLNRGLPGSAVYDLSTDRHPHSSRTPAQQPVKSSSSFSRSRSATPTHGPPTTARSSSFWIGLNAPAIRTSKTSNRSRSPHTSRPYSAGLRRPRSNSTWPPSGCCFPGSPKKECWP